MLLRSFSDNLEKEIQILIYIIYILYCTYMYIYILLVYFQLKINYIQDCKLLTGHYQSPTVLQQSRKSDVGALR